MISTFFLTLFNSFINLLLGLLPTGDLPTEISSAIMYFFAVANQFTYVFPVYTLIQAIIVVLIFDGVVLLWQAINWIIRKVPGMQ